jgi:hypothetical protein
VIDVPAGREAPTAETSALLENLHLSGSGPPPAIVQAWSWRRSIVGCIGSLVAVTPAPSTIASVVNAPRSGFGPMESTASKQPPFRGAVQAGDTKPAGAIRVHTTHTEKSSAASELERTDG